jgi:hypothetical protein
MQTETRRLKCAWFSVGRRSWWSALTLFVVLATSLWGLAQNPWRRSRGRDWQSFGREEVPSWELDRRFAKDTFTFVRIKYDSAGYRRGGGWATDFRSSELNFSLRLQQLTTLKVNPEPIVLELSDPRLFDYPFIYIIEPGDLMFYAEEVSALRRYLLRGGFLMVDDFWGDEEYDNFYREMKRVFPDREPQEVPLEHEIFQCVYPLKEKPQLPSIRIRLVRTRVGNHLGASFGVRTPASLTTARSTTTRVGSWSSSATTPTLGMAGSVKGRIHGTLKSFPSRKRIPWASTSLPTP